MINCDEILNTFMQNEQSVKEYLIKISSGAKEEMEDDIFALEKFTNLQPYIVSEDIFLKFLNMAKQSKQYKKLLRELIGFIVIKENVTDNVFNELLNMAKRGDDWIFLDLCHANLSAEKQNILKSLNLPAAFWY